MVEISRKDDGRYSEPLKISVNRQVTRGLVLVLRPSHPRVEGRIQAIHVRQQLSALAARCNQQRALGSHPEGLLRLLLVQPAQWDLEDLTSSQRCEPRPGDFAQGCTFTHTSGYDSLPGPSSPCPCPCAEKPRALTTMGRIREGQEGRMVARRQGNVRPSQSGRPRRWWWEDHGDLTLLTPTSGPPLGQPRTPISSDSESVSSELGFQPPESQEWGPLISDSHYSGPSWA